MVISTPTKVLSSLAVTATSVTGIIFTYKYATDLYAIEKVAIDAESWKVSEPVLNNEANPTSLKVAVSAELTNSTFNKHGITEGTWTCEIVVKQTNSTNKDSDKSKLKKVLAKYFPSYSSASTSNPATVSVVDLNRRTFVENCSRARKQEAQTNTKVTASVEVSLEKIEEDLEKILGIIPLNEIEKKVYETSTVTVSAAEFTFDNSSSPTKVTGTITTTGLDSGESWSCTIEGTTIDSSSLTNTDVRTGLHTALNQEFEKPGTKEGLVKSCARNKENSTSTLKLRVSKGSGSESNNLKFDTAQLEKVFKGFWTNS